MTICLGRRSPDASSGLPGSHNGPGRPASPRGRNPATTAPLFGLAPGGVYQARAVTRPAGELLPHRFTLTPTAERSWRFTFCCTFPSRSPGRWALPTTAPYGVRTFLPKRSPHVAMRRRPRAVIRPAITGSSIETCRLVRHLEQARHLQGTDSLFRFYILSKLPKRRT